MRFNMLRYSILLFMLALSADAQRRRQTGTQGVNAGTYNLPAVTFRGELKEITSKQIFLDGEDGQTLTIFRNHKTKFLSGDRSIDPKKIEVGTRLTLDVSKNPDGTLLAVNVMVDKTAEKTVGKTAAK